MLGFLGTWFHTVFTWSAKKQVNMEEKFTSASLDIIGKAVHSPKFTVVRQQDLDFQ